MGRYNFVSPGGAASEGILEILAQRRAEERERMLDEISAKNAEVQRAATEENIRASKEADDRARLETASQAWDLNEDLSNQPEDLRQIAARYGQLRSRPTTGGIGLPGGIPADAGGMLGKDPADHNNYFLGTQEQRDKDRKRTKAKELGLRLKPGSSIADIASTVLEAEGEDIDVDSGVASALTRPQPGNRYIWDEASNKVVPMTVNGQQVTGNDDVTVRNRPPREPRDTGTIVGTNPDGLAVYLINGRQVIFKGGQTVPYDGPIGPKPGSKSTKTDDPTAGGLVNETTGRQMMTLRGSNNPEDRQKARELAMFIIEQTKTIDPSINEAVRLVLDGVNPVTGDPLPDDDEEEFNSFDAEQLGDMMLLEPGANPKEVDQFKKLVRITRGF